MSSNSLSSDSLSEDWPFPSLDSAVSGDTEPREEPTGVTELIVIGSLTLMRREFETGVTFESLEVSLILGVDEDSHPSNSPESLDPRSP